MTSSSPSLVLRLVLMKGFSPLIRLASASITSRLAPTYGAKSILLMSNKSERVMPGPPFLGIFSPSATSITKMVRSAKSGEKVAGAGLPELTRGSPRPHGGGPAPRRGSHGAGPEGQASLPSAGVGRDPFSAWPTGRLSRRSFIKPVGGEVPLGSRHRSREPTGHHRLHTA